MQGNVRLVAHEFQALDFTVKLKSNKDTSFGWTEEKFEVFITSARTKLEL